MLADRVGLELEADGQLCLAGVADTDAQEAVEVKQRRSRKRIDVVLVVEGVEDFDLRSKDVAFAEAERAGYAEVGGKECIVLAKQVALHHFAVDDTVSRDRLSGMRLHPDIRVEAPRKICNRVEVELVALVAVRIAVF